MNRILLLLSSIAVGSAAAWPQVQVLNSSSLQPGLPSGGSLATIFFTIPPFTLTSGTYTAPASRPLPFTLGGLEVLVNNSPAPLLSVDIPDTSPYGRIDFQVPMARNGTLPIGGPFVDKVDQGTLQLGLVDRFSGKPLGGLYLPLTPLPPAALGGFFSDGNGYASALHASDGSPVTLANPAHAGETIIVFADDFYDVWPPVPVGLPVPADLSFQLDPRLPNAFYPYPTYLYLQGYPGTGVGTGNGSHATTPPLQITFQGLATGQIGVEEIHFVVPTNQAPGDWALFFHSQLPSRPVIENGGFSSPYVLLPVR